ncbi:MAG: transcriptional repressor LexA [bacterium]|nr:transcriptional repressor LexA [bacterium]
MQDKEYQKIIYSFYDSNNRMPSFSEMLKLFGLRSKNAIYKIVNSLVEEGIVSKDHLGRLLPTNMRDEIPMLGFVTAGLPADVEAELTDRVNLNDMLISRKNFTYMLEVDGDSMIDAHIERGDMVLVEKTDVAKDMDIVVAEVDGEFTMKYFRQKGTKSWLEPANKKYSPIYPTCSLKVIGRIKAVIRQY